MMGQDIYLLSAPMFKRTVIHLGRSGHSLTIEALNTSAEDNRYIVSATLNGKPLDRAWIRHEEIVNGAVICFELSEHRTDWGMVHVPPSPMSERELEKSTLLFK